jgi:hypothetical protein
VETFQFCVHCEVVRPGDLDVTLGFKGDCHAHIQANSIVLPDSVGFVQSDLDKFEPCWLVNPAQSERLTFANHEARFVSGPHFEAKFWHRVDWIFEISDHKLLGCCLVTR